MSEPLLEIKDLTLMAGEKCLVNNISITIKKNSIMGLVGESGSGKTLTALSIPGLLPRGVSRENGCILLHGEQEPLQLESLDTRQINRVRRSSVSMIFQEPMTSLNPSMKCGAQASEALHVSGNKTVTEAKQRVLELFHEVRLPDPERIYSAWPHELSGGQRQRVMIAMALSISPDLLIADEPTTALDVTVQKSILELLLELKRKYELSILFITHDLMVINQIADEVAVMYRGEIVEMGAKDKILQSPVSPYTKGLLACKPDLDSKPVRLKTISDFIKDVSFSTESTPRNTIKLKTDEILLSVKNLNVEYRSRKRSVMAVRSVSFDVFRGETLGLVGESGCGKTTLGRTILQLVEASSGSVEYRGKSLDQLSPKELRKARKNIQIVFQDPYSSLNPVKTVGNIISEPLRLHHPNSGKKEISQSTIELLVKVGLDEDAVNLFPHQFSGGQRQRIGIARAIACNPEFIVLDESVSALDVSVQAQILNLLNDLKEQLGLTYIFISHDLTVVKYMSDRVMVMSDGRIIETGESAELYANPVNDYTKTLIDSIPK